MMPLIPETFACVRCDADSPSSFEEAVRQGWTEIQADFQGASWNYLGVCPDCKAEAAKKGGEE